MHNIQRSLIAVASAIALAACVTTPAQPPVNGNQPPGGTRGGSAVEFKSLAQFTTGGRGQSGTAAAACLVTNSAAELEQRISQGLPPMLREAKVDFAAKTLISVYAGSGTSMEVTGVAREGDELVVHYRTITDQGRLMLTVIYAPNEHLTVSKTALPVRCVAAPA
jgi:hypothetical protein